MSLPFHNKITRIKTEQIKNNIVDISVTYQVDAANEDNQGTDDWEKR